jgi:hypothetical protein
MDDFVKWYEQQNPNKSKSTYDAMKYNYIRIRKTMCCSETDLSDLNENDFNDPAVIINKVYPDYSLNTTIQTCLGIKYYCLFRGFKDEIQKLCDSCLKTLIKDKNEIINSNQLSEVEKENWVDYPTLQERMKQYYEYTIRKDFPVPEGMLDMDKKLQEMRNFTMLAMYTFLPPTRIGNYQKMVVRYTQDARTTPLKKPHKSYAKKHNYLFIDEGDKYRDFTLVFNQYKTSKYLGQIIVKLEQDKPLHGDGGMTYKILSDYVIFRRQYFRSMTKTKQHPYLFFNLNSQKEMLTGNNYTGILQNTSNLIVGKKLSVNLLRHIYITHFLKKESSIQDKTIIAEFMGQGYTPTMLEKYNRVNLNEMAEEVLEGTALKGMVLHFD